jgi:hypothetical protein
VPQTRSKEELKDEYVCSMERRRNEGERDNRKRRCRNKKKLKIRRFVTVVH